jgi:hypothetical protein
MDWGSRLIIPEGRELLKTMERNNLEHTSTWEPTYWPSGRNKLPDLGDFCVTKGIPKDFTVAMFWVILWTFSGLDHTKISRKQCLKNTCFRSTLSKSFSATSLRKWTQRREALIQLLETTYQLEPPINHLKRSEVQEVINSLNPKRNHRVMTSSLVKFINNHLLLE